jgi:hypothetical protein
MAVLLPTEEFAPYGYVVAAEMPDGGLYGGDAAIGTWAVGELGGGPILALNDAAQESSEWGTAAREGSPADAVRVALARSEEAYAAEVCVNSPAQ